MRVLKYVLGVAVVAAGVLGASQAFAADETRCSGKGCLDIPKPALMHSETYVIDEEGDQIIYSEGDVQLVIDANGYPVIQADGQTF